MPIDVPRTERLRARALELGVYLPLGAYARVREELTEVDPASLRRLVDGFVDRGQQRLRPLQALVELRRNQASREVGKRATQATTTARKAAGRATDSIAPRLPRVAIPKSVSELPIAGYGALTVDEIASRLKGLTQTDLAKVFKFERANEGRSTVLEAVESRLVELPIPSYDALTADEIAERLARLDEGELETLRRYEADTKDRSTVLEKIDSLLA